MKSLKKVRKIWNIKHTNAHRCDLWHTQDKNNEPIIVIHRTLREDIRGKIILMWEKEEWKHVIREGRMGGDTWTKFGRLETFQYVEDKKETF